MPKYRTPEPDDDFEDELDDQLDNQYWSEYLGDPYPPSPPPPSDIHEFSSLIKKNLGNLDRPILRTFYRTPWNDNEMQNLMGSITTYQVNEAVYKFSCLFSDIDEVLAYIESESPKLNIELLNILQEAFSEHGRLSTVLLKNEAWAQADHSPHIIPGGGNATGGFWGFDDCEGDRFMH